MSEWGNLMKSLNSLRTMWISQSTYCKVAELLQLTLEKKGHTLSVCV
jgi:hypothetical protein